MRPREWNISGKKKRAHLADLVTSVELSYTDVPLRSGCSPHRTAFQLSGGRNRWLSCHLVTSSNNSDTFLPAAAEPDRSSRCIIGLISAGRPSAPPPVWYTNKITHRLECNSYSSAWQIAARPEEIEKAGKVSGSWQWLWLWWSILLLPLLTLPNMRDLHSPPTNHPPTHTHTPRSSGASQLYKQRGTAASVSISSTKQTGLWVQDSPNTPLIGYFVFMFSFALYLILRFWEQIPLRP